MIIAQKLARLQLVTPTEDNFLKSDLDTVAALHYKAEDNRVTQMSHLNAVQKSENKKLKQDW